MHVKTPGCISAREIFKSVTVGYFLTVPQLAGVHKAINDPCLGVACVAGGIVGAQNKVFAAELLNVSGEAVNPPPHSPRGLPLSFSGFTVKTLFRACNTASYAG